LAVKLGRIGRGGQIGRVDDRVDLVGVAPGPAQPVVIRVHSRGDELVAVAADVLGQAPGLDLFTQDPGPVVGQEPFLLGGLALLLPPLPPSAFLADRPDPADDFVENVAELLLDRLLGPVGPPVAVTGAGAGDAHHEAQRPPGAGLLVYPHAVGLLVGHDLQQRCVLARPHRQAPPFGLSGERLQQHQGP
jgi:hypothetical protein